MSLPSLSRTTQEVEADEGKTALYHEEKGVTMDEKVEENVSAGENDDRVRNHPNESETKEISECLKTEREVLEEESDSTSRRQRKGGTSGNGGGDDLDEHHKESSTQPEKDVKDHRADTQSEGNREGESATESEAPGSKARENGDDADDTTDEPTEMTDEEKEAMYEAVVQGDIDLLDDLLDLPGADINMVLFNENLLMTAIRAGHQDMSEFLLDNGVDYNFEAIVLDIRKKEDTEEADDTDSKPPTTPPKQQKQQRQKQQQEAKQQQERADDKLIKPGWYVTNCRQMAYERGLLDVVQIIDDLNGERWPFLKPLDREKRLKRPLEEKLRERAELEGAAFDGEEGDNRQEGEGEDEGSAKEDSSSEQTKESNGEDASSEPKSILVQKDNEEASSGSGSLPTPRGATKEVSFLLPGENTEHSHPVDKTYRPHKPTKSFLFRKSYNEKLTHWLANTETIDVFQPRMSLNSPGNANKVRPSLNNSGKHSSSMPDIRSAATWPSRDSVTRFSPHTRIMSPWTNDDPVMVRNLRKRAKSADVIVLNSGGKNQKPTSRRSHTLLSFVPESEPKLETTRRRKTFLEKPRHRDAQDSVVIENSPVPRYYPSFNKIQQRSEHLRTKTTMCSQRKSEKGWTGRIASFGQTGQVLSKRQARACQHEFASRRTDDRNGFGATCSSYRQFGAKRPSPAGVVRTVSYRDRHLPLINSI